MKIQHLTPADALARLKSPTSGVDDAKAARCLAEFGRNQVEEIARKPLPLTNPFSGDLPLNKANEPNI